MTKQFLQWWLIFVLQCIAVGIAYYFDLHTYALEHDKTYLTFVLLAMWFFTSLKLGQRIYKQSETSDERYWFIAESSMSVGMVGTVVGFIMMLDGSNLAAVDPSDTEAMKAIIGQLASGMSTALITTFMGLVVALALRVQLIINGDTSGDD